MRRVVPPGDGLPPFLWADTNSLMKQLGMQVTEEEERILTDDFTTYMGPGDPPPPPGAFPPLAQLGDDFAPYAADEVAAARGQELSAAEVRDRRPDVP